MAAHTKTIHEIIDGSIELTESCWIWKRVVVRGYGQITHNKRAHRAHRLIYELLVGPIPDGLVIDHLCRNNLCVNPDHLEPVTIQENTLRGIGPSAKNAQKTYCIRGHKFTPTNTYHRSDRKDRSCIACQRIRSIQYLNKRMRG